MEPIPTNDLTDDRQRYERALLQLGAGLDARRLPYRLVVDDRRGGDRVALAAQLDDELVELWLERHSAARGRAWLLTQSVRAVRAFRDAVADVAEKTPRRATVQRGCLLTVAAMARQLSIEAADLQPGHPRAAFARLIGAFPDARPMVGLQAPIRAASVLGGADEHLAPELMLPAYGAVVGTAHGPRAARWLPSEGGFAPPPSARRRLLDRFGRIDRAGWVGMAIATPVALGLADDEADDEDEASFDVRDAADCGDCGGCDVSPDCFSCDLGAVDFAGCFDVVPDCGGLDCVPLDCGF